MQKPLGVYYCHHVIIDNHLPLLWARVCKIWEWDPANMTFILFYFSWPKIGASFVLGSSSYWFFISFYFFMTPLKCLFLLFFFHFLSLSLSLSLKKLKLFPVQDFRKKSKISEYIDAITKLMWSQIRYTNGSFG